MRSRIDGIEKIDREGGGGRGATAIDKPRSHVPYCDDNDDVSAFVITEPTAAL